MSGKGSGARPFEVPREEFEASFDRIFGKRERKPWTPPPLPKENEQKETEDANIACKPPNIQA